MQVRPSRTDLHSFANRTLHYGQDTVLTTGSPRLPSGFWGQNDIVIVLALSDTDSAGFSLLPDIWSLVSVALGSVIVK